MNDNFQSEGINILRKIKCSYNNEQFLNSQGLESELMHFSHNNEVLTVDELVQFLKYKKEDITEDQILEILQMMKNEKSDYYTIKSIQNYFNQIQSKYPSVISQNQKINQQNTQFYNMNNNFQVQQNQNSKYNSPFKMNHNEQGQQKQELILVDSSDSDEEEQKTNIKDGKNSKQNSEGKNKEKNEFFKDKKDDLDNIVFKQDDKMISEDSFESFNQKLGYLKEKHIAKEIDINQIKQLFPGKSIEFTELLFYLSSLGIELNSEEQLYLQQSLVDNNKQTKIFIEDFLEFMNLNDNYYKNGQQIQNMHQNYNNNNQQNINNNIYFPVPPQLNNRIHYNNIQPNQQYNNNQMFMNNNQRNRIFQPPFIPNYPVIPNINPFQQNIPYMPQNNVIQYPNQNIPIQIPQNQIVPNNNKINNNNINQNRNNNNNIINNNNAQIHQNNNLYQNNQIKQQNEIQKNNLKAQENMMLNSQCGIYEPNNEQIDGFENFILKLTDCQMNKKEFIDGEFPPSESSIVDKNSYRYQDWRKLGWYRPIGFFNGQIFKMFSKIKEMSQSRVGLGRMISPNDIQQGILGDCYFLSALSCLAQEPHRILDLFITREINQFGIYCVKVCHDGEWKAVVLDDHIPCLNKKPAFTKANGNELWVLLIEKAWAKLFKSYSRIESGHCCEALRALTGAPTANFLTFEDVEVNGHTIQQMNQQLLPILQDALSETHNYLITAGNDSSDLTKSQADKLGLVTSHAYSVIGFKEITHPRVGNVTLVKLRNPWGKKEWTGDWSDGSPLWTAELKEQVRLNSKTGGIFYMSVQDFYKYFNQITICYYHDFFSYTSRKVLQSDSKHSNYFTLKINVKGTYYISLIQPNKRNFDKDIGYAYCNGKILVLQLKDENNQPHLKYIGAVQKKSNEVFIECNLEPGEYLIQSKVQWENHVSTSYVVSTYGVSSTVIEPILKSQLPPQFLEECFKTHARKNSNLKMHGQNIMKCKHLDHKLGYGYYYVQNISKQALQITVNFSSYQGLKFKKPQRVPQISFVSLPQSDCIAVFTVSHLGYHMQYSESINYF